MTLRISAICLLPTLLIGPGLRAQSVFHDSDAPQVSFAAAEIARALGLQRAAPDRAMRDLTSDTSSLRFAIAAGADESKVACADTASRSAEDNCAAVVRDPPHRSARPGHDRRAWARIR